jgi:hypothetical protein
MHADFSVELGRDDAALELPWSSADPALRFYDLKKHPELLQQIPEAVAYPELGAFLCADQCRRVSPGDREVRRVAEQGSGSGRRDLWRPQICFLY